MKTNLLKEAVLHLVSTWSLVKLSSIKFFVYALRNSENEMAFFRKHFIVFSSIQDTVKKCYTAKEQKKMSPERVGRYVRVPEIRFWLY